MYFNGQMIFDDQHFIDHMHSLIPVQIFYGQFYRDIGYIEECSEEFILINNIFYSRQQFTFISRPGY